MILFGIQGCIKRLCKNIILMERIIERSAAICVRKPRRKSMPMSNSVNTKNHVKKSPKRRCGKVSMCFKLSRFVMCMMPKRIKIKPRMTRKSVYASGAKNCIGKILSMKYG